jgi:alkaline phosphatase
MKTFFTFSTFLIAALCFAAPKNVIIMIPDGTGHASLTIARQLKGAPLAIDGAIYSILETRSADNSVTDSAAAATAMACGQRTYNGAVGVDVHQTPIKSISEHAKCAGKAVGIVTTDLITGATPSGFSAHVSKRDHATDILEQQIDTGFDVFMGGGQKYLTEDIKAYLAERHYTLATTRDEMNAAEGKVFGLFSHGLMTAEVERRAGAGASEPTLTEMTQKTIDLLDDDPEGFFLMVEGAQVDKGNHENDLPWATYDLLEFDNAVGYVLNWAKEHPDTLVFIAPDHETGGITLLNEPHEGARAKALTQAKGKKAAKPDAYYTNYSTTWHTGVDVFVAGNTPSCRPIQNEKMLEAIIGETVTPLVELHGETVTENGIPWLKASGGKVKYRAQRDAIYIRATNKWYLR